MSWLVIYDLLPVIKPSQNKSKEQCKPFKIGSDVIQYCRGRKKKATNTSEITSATELLYCSF